MSDQKETFSAYYFGFDATGDERIDAILKAVARAGKGCHHTEDWNDHDLVRPIQEAANAAALPVPPAGTREAVAKALDGLPHLTLTQGHPEFGIECSMVNDTHDVTVINQPSPIEAILNARAELDAALPVPREGEAT